MHITYSDVCVTRSCMRERGSPVFSADCLHVSMLLTQCVNFLLPMNKKTGREEPTPYNKYLAFPGKSVVQLKKHFLNKNFCNYNYLNYTK